MDKIEFIQKAPQYYVLALAVIFDRYQGKYLNWSHATVSLKLSSDESIDDWFDPAPVLLSQAIKILVAEGVIEIIPDDFGPTLHRVTDKFPDWMEEIAPQKFPIFAKYKSLASTSWLLSALLSLHSEFKKLSISEEDFESFDANAQWKPIPIDRANEKLTAATVALDEAIEQIEQNNGYAVSAPGEREYVLENLKTAKKAFKERSQIYYTQLKSWIIEPLSRVAIRFGDAAAGVSASAARQALIDWFKSLIENGFPNIFS